MFELAPSLVIGAFIIGVVAGAVVVTYLRSNADKDDYYNGPKRRSTDEHEDNAI